MSPDGPVTRAVVFTLDPSPAEERLLRSYCGAARKAYNWAIGEVTANLAARAAERASGVPTECLTPALSWSAPSLSKRWNAVKDVEAPWWLHPDRHQVRLMLPRWSPDPELHRRRHHLGWLHTVEPTGRLYRLVEESRATIQKVTLSLRGGRSRAQRGSKSWTRLLRRRARLHGRVTQTRALHLHRVTTALAGAFDVVAVEDLNLAGMATRKRHMGRRLADASLGELRRQLTYKMAVRGHQLVAIGRFFPSSKTCSACEPSSYRRARQQREPLDGTPATASGTATA